MATDRVYKLLEKIDCKTEEHMKSLSRIDEHLRNLNSKVATNVNSIELNRQDIQDLKIRVAKGATIIGIVLVILQLASHFF